MSSLTAWYLIVAGGLLAILATLALAWIVERNDG